MGPIPNPQPNYQRGQILHPRPISPHLLSTSAAALGSLAACMWEPFATDRWDQPVSSFLFADRQNRMPLRPAPLGEARSWRNLWNPLGGFFLLVRNGTCRTSRREDRPRPPDPSGLHPSINPWRGFSLPLSLSSGLRGGTIKAQGRTLPWP